MKQVITVTLAVLALGFTSIDLSMAESDQEHHGRLIQQYRDEVAAMERSGLNKKAECHEFQAIDAKIHEAYEKGQRFLRDARAEVDKPHPDLDRVAELLNKRLDAAETEIKWIEVCANAISKLLNKDNKPKIDI